MGEVDEDTEALQVTAVQSADDYATDPQAGTMLHQNA